MEGANVGPQAHELEAHYRQAQEGVQGQKPSKQTHEERDLKLINTEEIRLRKGEEKRVKEPPPCNIDLAWN